jgi:acyl-coenzyme A synthetase/AMP-(fatty) acid ligase/acyl carrier protein
VRQFVVGGEILSGRHVARAIASTGATVANGYGPTEAGVFVCCHRFTEDDLANSPPPVGRPLPATEVRILDERLRPVSEGELYLGGDALARGYHGRPDLTAATFLPDPAGSGARLYRSGDLARALPGGLVQVLGRLDDQVKIRGNRVELGEVEAALGELPGVRQAAVVVRDSVLAAYVVPDGADPTVAWLRDRLAARLPDYMIPSEYHRLDALPTSRHGKLDRAALGAGATRLPLGIRYVAANSELESTIAALWADLLDVPAVGMDDNYFDLGGTSMSVPVLARRIQRELGARLPATALYEHPTVRALAKSIAHAGAVS